MFKYCKFHVAGKEPVPYQWQNIVKNTVYRLLYVHSGVGGYYLGDKMIPFKVGYLYLIPSYANISTYSSYESEHARLNHSYVNFELIPPIVSNDVLELDPNENTTLRATIDVLLSMCERCHRKSFYLDDEEIKYFESTVIFCSKL